MARRLRLSRNCLSTGRRPFDPPLHAGRRMRAASTRRSGGRIPTHQACCFEFPSAFESARCLREISFGHLGWSWYAYQLRTNWERSANLARAMRAKHGFEFVLGRQARLWRRACRRKATKERPAVTYHACLTSRSISKFVVWFQRID